MKLFYVFLIILIHHLAISQDTIFKRSGDIISAKIIEINIKEISYKRADLIDGPLFICDKHDIKKIKYFNGQVDSFPIKKDEPLAKNLLPATMSPFIKESYRKGKYMFQGNQISDYRVYFLLSEKNRIVNNKEITMELDNYKRYRTLQYAVGFGGAGLAAASFYGASLSLSGTSSVQGENIGAVVMLSSVGVFVTSQVLSAIYKKKRLASANKMVLLYNQFSIN